MFGKPTRWCRCPLASTDRDCRAVPISFVILEARYYGMSPGLAQYLVTILNAASLFGRTIPGFLADKIGR